MLPREFTRVEYIESTGSQYVDTGFKPNQDTRVVMDCNIISSTTYPTPFGAWDRDSVNSFLCVYLNSSAGYYYYENAYYSFNTTNGYGAHTIEANKNVLIIDGTVVAQATKKTFSCSRSLYLCAYNSGSGAANLTSMRISACQVYDNGILVRDYIPYIDENGEANLWDDVNEAPAEKYGTFIAGPVIAPPSAPEAVRTSLAIMLRWAESANALHYNIYRDGTLIGTADGTQYIDTTAEENRTYTYGISAVGLGGESAATELTVYTRSGYFQYKPLIQTANFP